MVTQNIRHNYIDWSNVKYVDEKSHKILKKSHCHKNQVLVTMAGEYLGRVAVYDTEFISSSNQAIAKITFLADKNPYFISTFLNTKYGQNQINRLKTITGQPNINMGLIKSLLIPPVSHIFADDIERIVRQSTEYLQKSKQICVQAEAMLLNGLGMADFKPSLEKVSVKSFSDSFGTSGRLDAEYYQKKYDDYLQYVQNYCRGYTSVQKKFQQVKTSFQRVKSEYPYIEIGDINVGDGTYSYNLTSVEDLPANAKIKVEIGDLIVSKVRPYRGAVSIIRHNLQDLVVSGAFTVLRKTSDYPIETLAVLFRTPIYKDWLLKWNVGSSYPVIKDEDVMNILIPLFDDDIHDIVKATMISSENLKQKSEQLLEQAKQAVEMSIEKDEQTALDWLASQE